MVLLIFKRSVISQMRRLCLLRIIPDVEKSVTYVINLASGLIF